MFRGWIVIFAVGLLIVGCASKKKQEEGLESGQVPVTNQPIEMDSLGSDSGRIEGLYTINFDFDKSTLTPKAKELLKQNAAWMRANPGVKMQVEGHCDSRGSIEYNLGLGERRAKAAVNYLVSLGIDSRRLSVVSYGKERPIAMGDSEEAHAKNRRANFVPLR